MTFTPTQRAAIAARGNILVVAGAGTGKTSTLVERCLNCLLEEKPRASLDEILIVTFTDAAAADVRKRIRERLDQELEKELGKDNAEQRDRDLLRHLQEQLAIFQTAHLGTLHSFCLQLVRQHFYVLELDPQLTVLPAEEAHLLARETLDALLQRHYAGRNREDEAVQELIQDHARGSDQPIRALVLRLHHYSQTLPDPAGWFAQQLDSFAMAKPLMWQDWLGMAISQWPKRWLPILERIPSSNEIAAKCVAVLKGIAQAAPFSLYPSEGGGAGGGGFFSCTPPDGF